MSASRGRRGRRAPRRRAPDPARRATLPEPLILLLLGILTVALFHATPGAEFTYDDHLVVVQSGSNGTQEPHDVSFRPVRGLSFRVDRALFGSDPYGYHVHSLLWHLLCVMLVYALARRLTGSALLALAVAALFTAHPVHVEAVTNVTNRKEPLCLAFSLGALLAYARFLDRPVRSRLHWLALAVCSGLVALGSKEVALATPLVCVAYEWLFVPPERHFVLRRPRLLAAGAAAGVAAAVAFFLLSFDVSHLERVNTLNGYLGDPVWSHFAFTAGRSFWTYLGLLVWPGALCPDHTLVLSTSLAEPAALLGWLGLLAFAAAALWLAPREPLLGFGLLWLLVQWLPISNLLPVLYALADRYLYAPSVGYCLALVALAQWLATRVAPALPHAKRLAAAVLVVAIAAYGVRTVSYNRVWLSDVSLWTHGVACNPLSVVARLNLAEQLRRRGDPENAIAHLSRAIELKPRYVENVGPALSDLYSNRGAVFHQMDRYADARADFERAIAADPESAAAHFNLGSFHRARGDLSAARASYRRAARLGMAQARRVLETLAREEARAQLH